MRTINSYFYRAMADLLLAPSSDEKYITGDSLRNGLATDFDFQEPDLDSLAYYSIQQGEHEPYSELGDWPEEDMDSLLYEMSTEDSTGMLEA
jgi:hypothetical protein